MTANYRTASAEMFAITREAVASDATRTLVGYTPEVRWPEKDDKTKTPGADKIWLRATRQDGDAPQATFRGDNRKQRYEMNGVLFVQVFAPDRSDAAKKTAEILALALRDAYRGKSTASGVWFRNCRTKVVGSDGTFYSYNVIIEFKYDEEG